MYFLDFVYLWLCWVFVAMWHVCVLSHFSCVRLSETPWTMAHQTPLSMGFSRQEYWSGLLFPSPRYMLSGVNSKEIDGTVLLANLTILILIC